jgi:DNA polymerase-1
MDIKFNRELIKTNEQFNVVLEIIKEDKVISLDTENSGLNPKFCTAQGFSFSVDGKTGYYVPVNHVDCKTNLGKRFKEVLKNKKIIVMHNAVYDAGIFEEHYDSILGYTWFDTMIAQHLLDENNPKGLKFLTKKYFGYEQTSYKSMSGGTDYSKITCDQIWEYACDDAILTYKLFELQKEKIKEEGLKDLMMNIEMPFQKVLLHMKRNGITFDLKKSKEIAKTLQLDKTTTVNEIIKVTPQIKVQMDLFGEKHLATNIDSAKDLKVLLYDKLNLPVLDTTKSGAPAVDTPTLKMLKMKDEWLHPLIPLLIKYKEIGKLLSSYTTTLSDKVESTGKLYGDLKDHGTVTGRLSCENPNFQQLPKNDTYKIRSLFKSSPGYKMYVADFSQEELRVCGVVTNSPTFKKAFNDGEDLHLKVANECYNLKLPIEETNTSHPKYKEHCETYYKQRFNSKSINFGLMYGRTAFGLAPQLGLTDKEAQVIVDKYFETFPEVRDSMDAAATEIKLKGFTRNMFGRKRRFFKSEKGFYSKDCFRQGFNFKIQGGCADILRIVMNKCLEYVNTVGDEIKILTTIHDEIVFEIRDNENLTIHTKELHYIMENSVKLPIKLLVDGDTGNDYSEAK